MAAATRVLALLLVLSLAAIAGVWGQEQEQQQQQQQQEAAATAGGKKKGGGLLSRMARMLDTGEIRDDDWMPMSDAEWEATKDEGEAVDPSRPWDGSAELPDAWGTDRVLQMVQSTIDGNPTAAFKDMITNTQDLKEAWTNPVVFKYVLSQFPLFQVLKPLQAIARKDVSQITADDGRKGMQDFLFFVTRAWEILDMMRDSSKFAKFMSEYSAPVDPELVRLMNLVETSKDTPAAELNFQNLQKYIFKKELGDLVDLDMLGHNGVEPPFLGEFRGKVKEHAPFFYNNIIKDSMVRKYMENPFSAVEEARELASSYAAF